MITIPECDTTVLRTTSRDRSRTTDIPTSDPAIFLAVTTFHHKDRRQYVTHVGGVRISTSTGGRFGVRTLSLLDFTTVQVLDAGARFSERNLHDAHVKALKQIDEMIVLDPEPLETLLTKVPRD